MVNSFALRQFSLCYEKNSFQFSYFFHSGLILKEICCDLFIAAGFWVKLAHFNSNFYGTSGYLEVFPLRSSCTPCDCHSILLRCIKTSLCSSLLNGSNIFIYYLIFPHIQGPNTFLNSFHFTQIIQIVSLHGGADLLASTISNALIRNSSHQRSIDLFMKEFSTVFVSSSSRLLGAKFKVNGRINGVDRSKHYLKIFGLLSLTSVASSIDRGFSEAYTSSGKCSIHVWLTFNLHILMKLPKNIKFNKYHRRKSSCSRFSTGQYTSFFFSFKGDFALVSLDIGTYSSRQIDISHRVVKKLFQKKGSFSSSLFPDLPLTKKPLATRIGKGKGSVSHWVAKVKPGSILFEVSGVSKELAKAAFIKASAKLPFRTKFISQSFPLFYLFIIWRV